MCVSGACVKYYVFEKQFTIKILEQTLRHLKGLFMILLEQEILG